MVASLRNVARRHSSVVAVVGLGHLSGIQKHWKEDINVEELMTIPSANTTKSRRWFWSKVALGVGGIIAGVALYRQR
jgi:pheromone shutdown protein TraB